MIISFMSSKLTPYLLALVLAVGGFFYGIKIGKELQESKQKTMIVKAQSNRQKTNHEVKNLNYDIIVRKLADNGWLRND
jgi:hypothetical protein